MNEAIELHDSKVSEAIQSGATLTVRFAPAYLHRSEGVPGSDAGTCWVQGVDLIFADGVIESSFTNFPQEVDTGSLCIGDERFDNILPLPLARDTELTFSAVGLEGECLHVRAKSVRAVSTGTAQYVEEFPGSC